MSSFDSTFAVLDTTSEQEGLRRRLVKKLHQMADFKSGWSHGEGLPISVGPIRIAEFLVLIACDLRFTCDVFPNLDGGCAVALYEGDKRLEVSIAPDARLEARIEKGIGMDFDDVLPRTEVSIDEAIGIILQLRQHTWSSGYLTFANSTVTANVSGILSIDTQASQRSSLPMGVAGSQSFSRSAHARR